jgi:hypothetical protein
MALDVPWAAAVLDQVTAEVSAFLNEAGQQGIDQAARWLRPEHLRDLRRIMAPAQSLLETHRPLPAELRPRMDLYKTRLLELQAVLTEMNQRLQQGTTIIAARQEELTRVRLWLAAYRNSG